jgi:hypothetical protein
VSEGKRVLRDAFKRLEQEVPAPVVSVLRTLRHPDARWYRIPVGLVFVVGGVFSFLPVIPAYSAISRTPSLTATLAIRSCAGVIWA